MAKRAYGVEDKNVRRREILASARRLFMAAEGELPSAASIATAAGLAKGTLYLYFRTKEAIFADLLLTEWTEVLSEAEAAFAADDGRDALVAAFVTRFATYVEDHPELLHLDALGHEIERRLQPEALQAFKRDLNARLASTGAAVERALAFSPGRGLQVLMRTYALTRGLWLALGNGMGSSVEAGEASRPDFVGELADALAEYWRGALAAPAA